MQDNREIESEIKEKSACEFMPNLEDGSDVEYLEGGNILITREHSTHKSRRRLEMGFNMRASSTPSVLFKIRLVM